MIDPHRRWARHGEKPDYAGLQTFAGMPYSEDPADLAGIDVAVFGAPMDELVSDRPGARFGPRAIRNAAFATGRHLEAGIDPFHDLAILDYGDAAIIPADPAASHAAIEAIVVEIASAGAIPLGLGGDHSITEPEIRALAGRYGPLGLLHFDTHTDTGDQVWGVEISHGTPMYRLVESGLVDASRYVQIGLRGYWPGPAEFAWQERQQITAIFMHEIRDHGIKAAVSRAVERIGAGPCFVTIDVDVLDPAFAPATGTPEPGGMTVVDLLWATRTATSALDVVGCDVVEVAPVWHGTADTTALVGERIARELLCGIALHRRARPGT
jgi:agmatinase